MKCQNRIGEYVRSLKASPILGRQVVFHKEIAATEACFNSLARPWSDEMQVLLEGSGISRLYSHQVSAIDLVRSGRHVVVSTPTASGKTLVYNLPVIEQILEDPLSRDLYLFPLKALAQDQMKAFRELTACLDRDRAPTCATYDGDTSAWKRKRLKELPSNVLLTNPEMLHLSLLAHHEKWVTFWQGLTHVVIDEVHTYRGYPGTVMATWQRGGRVGRSLQDSALVLIAQEDALDQYFMRNPGDFLKRPPESAVKTRLQAFSGSPGRRHSRYTEDCRWYAGP